MTFEATLYIYDENNNYHELTDYNISDGTDSALSEDYGEYEFTGFESGDIKADVEHLVDDIKDLECYARFLEKNSNVPEIEGVLDCFLEHIGSYCYPTLGEVLNAFEKCFLASCENTDECLQWFDDEVYTLVDKHNLWDYFDSERYIDDEIIPNRDMQYFEVDGTFFVFEFSNI